MKRKPKKETCCKVVETLVQDLRRERQTLYDRYIEALKYNHELLNRAIGAEVELAAVKQSQVFMGKK